MMSLPIFAWYVAFLTFLWHLFLVVDRTRALSESDRTKFSAIICQKVRPKLGQTKLGQSLTYDAKFQKTFRKFFREWPKGRFRQGLAELFALSESSVLTLCQKVRPKFGRNLAEPKVRSITIYSLNCQKMRISHNVKFKPHRISKIMTKRETVKFSLSD